MNGVGELELKIIIAGIDDIFRAEIFEELNLLRLANNIDNINVF